MATIEPYSRNNYVYRYSYPRGNGPPYLMAQLAITSSTWIPRVIFFDGRQEANPYCKFS
jgi:hypothetical protein